MKHKLVIYGNKVYKEIILDENFKGSITFGTEKNCQLSFVRERYMTNFFVKVDRQEDGNFVISCNDSVYLASDIGIKEYVRQLRVGDHVSVCYDNVDISFLHVDFFVEFDRVGRDFDQYIDCSQYEEFTIGGNVSDTLRIDSPDLVNQSITIRKNQNGYDVFVYNSKYGIEINGFVSRKQHNTIKNGEFISYGGYDFCIKDGIVYTTKNAEIITKLKVDNIVYQKNSFRYPEFKKNVRQRYKLPDNSIEVLDPKSKQENNKEGFALTILPMIVNLGLMLVLRGFMGGGGVFVIYFAATMGISLIISIVKYVSDTKQAKEKVEEREKNYMDYLSRKEDEIIVTREQEKIIANQMHPTIDEYVNFIDDFDNRLFEKDKKHDDYLSVRIGDGIVKSNCPITYKKEEYVETEDDLKQFPKVLHDKYEYLNEMPILLEMKDVNAVGFIGSRSKLYQMTKNLIIEYSASHYYKDVKLYLIMDENDVDMFKWARWLPAFKNDATKTRNFMYDEDSMKFTLEYLYSELSRREQISKDMDKIDVEDYIVLVYRSENINNHPVSKYISKAKDLRFRFIYFEEYEELLNSECEKRIFLDKNTNNGYIQMVDDGKNIQEFKYSHVAKDIAERISKKMSCVYVDEISLENNLTQNISLYELLGIMTTYDLDLTKRWAKSQIYKSMAAPLGVKSGDEIVYLDLHEKAHGPHGLVAGTTGSGKSEIMQTYILSMATLFHPHEVGFIIIDFKGGGMVNQFRNLPHLNGAITNIDGNEIERSLLSIKAELIKRQEKFAEFNVNHIDDYIKLYKNGVATVPLPHLILIVDEFAELKSEQPEFMKELISAARIGRSLGVHLILATQKPSGVVSEQIWSNSKFKLCLKVQNKSDSNEVIKSPLAAEIREPGRAYLQVGNNEIFQLFQSAYSGASAKADNAEANKKYVISKVELSGKKVPIYEHKNNSGESGETQLEAVVNYVKEHCEMLGIEKVPDICLPSLAHNIPYTTEKYTNESTDIVVNIGMLDDPSKQQQYEEMFNVSQDNMYILGASQSGKTNLLQTIIMGLTSLYSPEEVNIYILDLASMILKNFESLNHVGGVIVSGEEEKLKSFLKMIQEMIQERKNLLSKLGLSSYSSYRESGKCNIPQVVVVLDNWVGFKNYFADYEDFIVNICRECVAVGITFIITSAQASGINYKLLPSFSKRIALYCNDSGDYSSVFNSCKKRLDDIAGRAIVEKNKNHYEMQIYHAFAAEKEYEKIELIKRYIEETNINNDSMYAKLIPEIPKEVTEQFMFKQFGKDAFGDYEIPLGMEFNSIDKRSIRLDKLSHVSFVGSLESSKNNYVDYMIDYLLTRESNAPVDIYIADDVQKVLQKHKDICCEYCVTNEGLLGILENVRSKLMERYEAAQQEILDLNNEPMQVIIVNSTTMIKTMGTEKKLCDIYTDIMKYKNFKVCFLYTNLDNEVISFTSGEALKPVRDNKNILVFEDINNIKVTDISIITAKSFKTELERNDAYWITSEKLEKIRTIKN